MKERVDGGLEGRASILDDNAQALSLALYIWTLRLSTYSTTGLLLQSGYIVIDRTAKCSMCSCLYCTLMHQHVSSLPRN